MKCNNELSQAVNYILLPAILLMPFFIGAYQGYESYIMFYCVYLGTLYTRVLAKPILTLTALFQWVQLINICTTDREIYFDQISSFVETPLSAISVAQGHISGDLILATAGYFLVTIFLIALSKPLKPSDTPELTVKLLTVLIIFSAYSTSNLHKYNKHPLIYMSQYLQGVVDNQMENLAELIPPAKVQKDIAPKIIFILGEAQGHISNVKDVMPHLNNAITNKTAVYFSDVAPLGNYTAISTNQIIESVELKDFEKPHTGFLQIPIAIQKESLYVSSRNLTWGKFEDKVNNRFNTQSVDCKQVTADCGLVEGVDDIKVLNELVLPFAKDKNSFFITWQMNGSHTPLKDKSPEQYKKFKDDYLNSIHYTDIVLNELRNKLPPDTWIVFVADHTQEYKLIDNAAPKVLSFIENTNISDTSIPSNKDSKLTQLDIVDALFALQGFETNQKAPTILNKKLSREGHRGIYRSHNVKTRVEVKP
ncbi:sulfatase-like hydrolase/transferase [Pseudoalteromonas marina]|uniref:Sulfatase-like hydrolase/transferase n=1 Tax=Pseudoalteromonas marina TaxID=267375 RepID=A0ABT9FHX3_9GAMM|nr:sulfatase-like hydrolase/transferase [Pseudoalteromonas marina]MDP2566393.1 sulfatase-like hydrolase/transferase [Pseudoalteromonas marina]